MSDLDLWVSPERGGARRERPRIPRLPAGRSRDDSGAHARHPSCAALRRRCAREDVAIDLHWSLVGHDTDRRAPSLDWFRARTTRFETRCHRESPLPRSAHEAPALRRAPPLHLALGFLSPVPAARDGMGGVVRCRSKLPLGSRPCGDGRRSLLRLGLELPSPLAAYARSVSMAIPEHKGGPERAWNELSTLSFRGRVALLKAYLFPSPSYVRFRYRPEPAWTWPLCYPVRWARLLSSAASLAVRPRRFRPLLGETPIGAVGPHPLGSRFATRFARAALGSRTPINPVGPQPHGSRFATRFARARSGRGLHEHHLSRRSRCLSRSHRGNALGRRGSPLRSRRHLGPVRGIEPATARVRSCPSIPFPPCSRRRSRSPCSRSDPTTFRAIDPTGMELLARFRLRSGPYPPGGNQLDGSPRMERRRHRRACGSRRKSPAPSTALSRTSYGFSRLTSWSSRAAFSFTAPRWFPPEKRTSSSDPRARASPRSLTMRTPRPFGHKRRSRTW